MAGSILAAQKEWNKGDSLPLGGPLPRNEVGRELQIVQSAGQGTKDNPRIMWHYEHNLRRAQYDFLVNLMSDQCRVLGFTHVWVRSSVHSTFTERDKVTGQKTGNYLNGDDPHLTVMFANSADWVLVHGHIYVYARAVNGKKPGLMPDHVRKLDSNGKSQRVVELWEWTPNGAEEELRKRERHEQIKQSQNWRSRV